MGCRRDPAPAAGACWEERGRTRAEPRPPNPALSHSSCREGIFSFRNPCLAGVLQYLTNSNNPSRSGATQQHPEQQIPAQHRQAVTWHGHSPMGTCSSWERSHQPAMPSLFQICSFASWQAQQATRMVMGGTGMRVMGDRRWCSGKPASHIEGTGRGTTITGLGGSSQSPEHTGYRPFSPDTIHRLSARQHELPEQDSFPTAGQDTVL